MFGLTEEQLTQYGVTLGLAAFIGLMLFIVWNLSRRSRASRLGTFVLFFVLAFGVLGFLFKGVLQLILGV